MIGYIEGKVVFSDGIESLISTNSGIGYQVYFHQVLAEGASISLYTSQIVRENSLELYGFNSLKEKKLFELLTSVKGVGPKSAFNLISALGFEAITQAILFDNKKTLSSAPGVGPKAAAQIILDLSSKINKMKMYSDTYQMYIKLDDFELSKPLQNDKQREIIQEALMACKELGFKEEEITSKAMKILETNVITKPEQLVHLVLKGI